MNKLRAQVAMFRTASRASVPEELGTPLIARLKLCASLIMEEPTETLEAMGADPELVAIIKATTKLAVASITTERCDVVEVADGLGDSDYVNEWTRQEFGIDGDPIADEIQRANMAKFGPGSSFREDGKVNKPPGWTPPNIRGELELQGWKPELWVIFESPDGSEAGMCLAKDFDKHRLDDRDTKIILSFKTTACDARERYQRWISCGRPRST